MGNSESSLRTGDTNISSETELARKQKHDEMMEIGKKVAMAAGVAIVGWGIYKILGGPLVASSERKKMKAPGMDMYIYREDFELDPKAHFHRLRH
ncbi:hypothetical protein LIER_22006 [Lithospermum erythrorhizon]|uniref:Uncharacterized protein n=1 Tax=Lithospermum erythrorhizon TaxID=34254 RepID=A0AAV3QUR2_LITER